MSDVFLGEIRVFGFNFPPRGWAFCNGQILPISQNTALFSLLGTSYGGNGISTFALPNLQGSAPLHSGQGLGLTPRTLGEFGGQANVTLGITQIPAHTHSAMAGSSAGDQNGPQGNTWASARVGRQLENRYAPSGANLPMNPNALADAGSSQPHNNLPPCLALNFCIALQGIYPSRS
ncbi:MAG TPA: tail fiber protein [Methylomirabilota bacterium]|jgi:microcystin-dependent protein|nr:tail fiber protein [Methylomirabilota bacterium]